MNLVRHTVRLPASLDKALRAMAHPHDVSVYAMLQRSVTTGITMLAGPSANHESNHELFAEVASLGVKIVAMERMLDRALFTACASYCYARSAAMEARKSDDIIAAEIKAAYERQRRLSQDDQS